MSLTNADNHTGGHPAHLAHHFNSMPQQLDAGKLGMWIFLGTEILLFGGLFCLYAVYRGTHPEIFIYGHRYLDVNLGAINTVILILSSFTMALAVHAAQCGHQARLKVCLALTILGGIGFLCVKYVEYQHKFRENLVWGARFYEEPAGEPVLRSPPAATAPPVSTAPTATTPAAASQTATQPAAASSPATSAKAATSQLSAAQPESWNVPPPAIGPSGLRRPAPEPAAEHTAGEPIDPRRDPARPENVHQFFAIYFCMTGLHGLHVIAGILVLGWLLTRALRGHFGANYYTPVDLGGLYWHLVDVIWIFLFPLFYLIH